MGYSKVYERAELGLHDLPMPLLDPTSLPGAVAIAQRINGYWQNRGYHGIRTRVIKIPVRTNDRTYKRGTYGTRSNIGPEGYPPGGVNHMSPRVRER